MMSSSAIRGRSAVVATDPSSRRNVIPVMSSSARGDAPASTARIRSRNTSSPSPSTTTSTAGNIAKVRRPCFATCVPPKITQPSGRSCLNISASFPNAL